MASMTTLQRLLESVRAGVITAVQTYNQDYFVAEDEFEYDSYAARMSRYWYNRRYVDNTIYSSVNRYAAWFKNSENLYKHIRGLRNPVHRLVQIEKAKVFGGFVNYQTFKDGALVLSGVEDKPSLQDAIRTIWQWSDIHNFKNLLIYEGASMGDVGIKVVDDPIKGKVYLEILDPRKVADVDFDSRGNVSSISIAYERYDSSSKKWYEYGERITKESFQTFYNGEPYAFNRDADGQGQSEWVNPYGFVPVEWIKHQDVGQKFGAVSFHASRSKIDNLNDLVSLLHDNIRMTVRTKYAVSGVDVPSDSTGAPRTISMSVDERDHAPFIKIGDGAITPVVFPINIAETLEAIQAMQMEIEADLPQLSLQTIRSISGNVTSGVAIENLYADASDSIQEVQGRYTSALTSATQMALSMAGLRRYDGFQMFNLNSYEAGALDFDIRPRDLFQDTLSKKEKVELTSLALKSEAPRLMLETIGYTEEQINEAMMSKDDVARQQVRAAFSDLMRLEEEPMMTPVPS